MVEELGKEGKKLIDSPELGPTEQISRMRSLSWLKAFVLLVFLCLLVLGGLLARLLFFAPKEPRTMAEMKIMKAQEMVKKKPYDPDGYVILGNAYLETGQDKKAAEEFKSAIKLAPEYWFAHYCLGNAYILLKEERKAQRELETALAINPKAGEVYYVLGDLLLKQKKYKEAVPLLESAIEVEPGAADTRFLLAKAYEETGKKEQALALYKEVLKLVPDFSAANSAIKRLTSESSEEKPPTEKNKE